jgi:hypothetical protein
MPAAGFFAACTGIPEVQEIRLVSGITRALVYPFAGNQPDRDIVPGAQETGVHGWIPTGY